MSEGSKTPSGRRERADPRQQDLFAPLEAPTAPPPATLPAPTPRPVIQRLPEHRGGAKIASTAQGAAQPPFGSDEWWTTRAVCAFLKFGRKALWNMRRNPASDFPEPVDAVGHRHLYRAVEVRAWMEAQRERARRRAVERRRALTQLSSSLST